MDNYPPPKLYGAFLHFQEFINQLGFEASLAVPLFSLLVTTIIPPHNVDSALANLSTAGRLLKFFVHVTTLLICNDFDAMELYKFSVGVNSWDIVGKYRG